MLTGVWTLINKDFFALLSGVHGRELLWRPSQQMDDGTAKPWSHTFEIHMKSALSWQVCQMVLIILSTLVARGVGTSTSCWPFGVGQTPSTM